MDNSETTFKRLFRKARSDRCERCGMLGREHYLRTGRRLHVHRVVPGSAYTEEGCKLLCLECHAEVQGLGNRRSRGVYQKLPCRRLGLVEVAVKDKGDEIASFHLAKEEFEYLLDASRELGYPMSTTLTAAIASLRVELEKYSGKIHDPY